MCNCGITHRIAYGMTMAISIFAILVSIACIQGALSGFFDPVMYYAGYNVGVMIQGLIMFLLLLVGGILGICGLKKKNFHCHFVMFFFILTVEGMATNVALNVQGIYMALSTNDDASLSDRYLVARDIEKVADLANSNFCSSVTGMCPCNLTNTAYYTQTSANPVPQLTITGLQTTGAISTAGKTKFQDCAEPSWYSEYKKPAAMMEALERFFDCSGFSAQTTPISNLYQFTDINSPGPIPGNVCLAHYDTLIYSSTFMIGGQFFSISMSALFLWVWLAVVGMNKGLSRQSMSQQISRVGLKGQD